MSTLLKGKGMQTTARRVPKAKTRKFDLRAIDKITVQIKKQIKAELAEPQTEPGRREFGLNVIIDGPRIRVYPASPTERRGLTAGVERPPFDPAEAGRKMVSQIQGAEGGAWTGAELLKNFHLTSATLHKRRSEYRIVAWRDAKHQFHYPKWQFTPVGALLPGVQEVLRTFHSSDEWRVMTYFLAPRHQLGDRAPLDLLRAGEVDKVIAHAKANGEENSW